MIGRFETGDLRDQNRQDLDRSGRDARRLQGSKPNPKLKERSLPLYDPNLKNEILPQQVSYSKLPRDLSERYVLLMDPVIGQGHTAVSAVTHLVKAGVKASKIVFLNLVSSPGGIHNLCGRYPEVQIITCCIDKGLAKTRLVYPGVGNFGDRYFGTEDE